MSAFVLPPPRSLPPPRFFWCCLGSRSVDLVHFSALHMFCKYLSCCLPYLNLTIATFTLTEVLRARSALGANFTRTVALNLYPAHSCGCMCVGSHRLVRERRQHDGLLHGVHHQLPQLLQHTLQHSLLADLGKQCQAVRRRRQKEGREKWGAE